MGLIRARPLTFKPMGLSDTIDGTNSFSGAMQVLQNLIPSLSTKNQWVPRPGAQALTTFGGFTTPGFISAMLTVGSIAYGMISTADVSGKDRPFAYNFSTNTFETITFPNDNRVFPTSPATSGDWTPPIMAQVGSRIIVTHPGFTSSGFWFGWFDISGFTSNTITGNYTAASGSLASLSSNVLQAGWQVGMSVSGTGIPAGTYIYSIASNGLSATTTPVGGTNQTGITLTVSGGTATAPLWGAGQMNGAITFTAAPVSVAQFYGRAYFACAASQAAGGVSVVFSDSGSPCQVTNATQSLAFRNGLPVTALYSLPLNSPISGGQIQGLLAFQGDTQIWQITGDASTSNLATNALNVATGTLAPLTIAATPRGVMFMAPDGVRLIDFTAQVSDPIGINGDGVAIPFINALHPSRACACYNQNVYRITVQNSASNSSVQEFWFDLTQKIWSGPHTFPASQIQPMQGTPNTFIMAASGINAKLWQSDVLPTTSSSYTENGAVLQWIFQTSLLPDNSEMAQNALVESTLGLNYGGSGVITVLFLDENNNTLDTLSLMGPSGVQSIWGTTVWGPPSVWGGLNPNFYQVRLTWHQPIVFKQGSLRLSGTSFTNLVLGNLYLKYQILGYVLETAS